MRQRLQDMLEIKRFHRQPPDYAELYIQTDYSECGSTGNGDIALEKAVAGTTPQVRFERELFAFR